MNLKLPYIWTILSLEALAKHPNHVTPVKTGVQEVLKRLDSRFRGNDVEGTSARGSMDRI
jgi:hypothetical protein